MSYAKSHSLNVFFIFWICFVALLWLNSPLGFVEQAYAKHTVPHSTHSANNEKFFLSGRVLDSHKEPVPDAKLQILIDGKPRHISLSEHHHGSSDEFESASDGSYQIVLELPQGAFEKSQVELSVYKPSFKPTKIPIAPADLAQKGHEFYGNYDVILPRSIGPAFWVATIIFLLAYILISFELLHRTIAAMLGASLILVISYTIGTFNPEFHIMSYERAVKAIDMNVIFLLMGMMVIVGILKHTGVFQWCAYQSYKLARGNVMMLSLVLMTFTAVSSAFLDNVTTMLLLTPVTIEIALSLSINPLALLIPEVLASNIGGTATLIGDPPNIMIGSYAGLTFIEFVKNLAPVCVLSLIVVFLITKIVYGKEYKAAKVEDIEGFIAQLREEYKITDRTLLTFGMLIMAIVIGMFLLHGLLHMEVSIAALFGGSVLFTYGLLTKKIDLLELIEKDIEWPTLLFFIFLFILVGAVEETGLLAIVADWVLNVSKGSLVASICLILWVSAFMSAFVDNIPFTATMLPIVAYLTRVIPGAESGVLWWALAFGACFGGNGTIIGASANVVTVGIAEAAGYPMRFFGFMKVGMVCMILTVALANVWLLLFY